MFGLKYRLYLILFFIPFILSGEGLKIDKISSLMDSFHEVSVKDSIIYAVNGDGIEVFDAKDLKKISLKSFLPLNDNINTVLAESSYLFVGGDKGIYIIDAKDKTSLKKLSFLSFQNPITGLDKAGDFIYVADGEKIWIVDVSSLSAPKKISSFKTPGTAYDIKVEDSKAYVADGEAGVDILDISNKNSIREIGRYESNSTASKISVAGDYAYVSYGEAGFRVIDISDPTNPTLTFDCDGPSHNCHGVDIIGASDGKTIYILDKNSGIKVANVVSPSSIHLASEYRQLGEFTAMDYEGGKIYIANKDIGIQIIDVSDKFHAKRVGFIETVRNPVKADAKENFLYIADAFGGFDIVDFKDPLNPKIVSNIELGCRAESVTVDYKEKYAYATDFCKGVHIIDISDKNNPEKLSVLVTPGRAYDIKVAGDRAYVADRSEGIEIIDIKDRKSPEIIGSAKTSSFAMALDIRGYAYLAEYNDTLSIYDIKNPKQAKKIGGYDTDFSGYAVDVVNSGDYTYLANYSLGMQIIDTSDPKKPSLVSVFDLNSSSFLDHGEGVDVLNDKAFIAYKDLGVAIVDISDRENPSLLNFLQTKNAKDVKVLGSYVIVCDEGSGLLTYKIDNDENIKTFVERLYTKLLNRNYDQEGLNYYMGRLLKGASAAEVAEIFYRSEEFRGSNLTTKEFLERTYETLLGREADQEGLEYWRDMIDNKHIPREVIFYKFIISPEFTNLSKEYGIVSFTSDDALKAFIKRMYLLALNREYDGEGLEFWFDGLRSGEKSAADIAFGFFDSKEFKNRNLSDRDFVIIVYRSLMNREASDEDVNFWVDYLRNHLRDDLVREFVNSDEFKRYAKEFGIVNLF
ncbi:MAG: DUF4214 domain-containing protein [Epsilonproteobacteria bacterium]|nr:DUF4214 domain-containing protein [Campylobacterota bacterium]